MTYPVPDTWASPPVGFGDFGSCFTICLRGAAAPATWMQFNCSVELVCWPCYTMTRGFQLKHSHIKGLGQNIYKLNCCQWALETRPSIARSTHLATCPECIYSPCMHYMNMVWCEMGQKDIYRIHLWPLNGIHIYPILYVALFMNEQMVSLHIYI